MSQPPPPYTQQPYPGASYHPQAQNPYPQYPQGNYGNPAPYPAGYHNPNQPQVIYVDRQPEPRRNDDCGNACCTSLFALLCGCCLGEVFCDQPCLCCVIPCPISLPRFR